VIDSYTSAMLMSSVWCILIIDLLEPPVLRHKGLHHLLYLHLAPNTLHLLYLHLAPYTLHLLYLHLAPYALHLLYLHLVPYTLHLLNPTSCAIPYTLHLAPYTLHPGAMVEYKPDHRPQNLDLNPNLPGADAQRDGIPPHKLNP
jgi:hypothetical protein